MSSSDEAVPQPPQPPEFEPKLYFYPYQLIGIPILFLIPILALFGVFGKTSATVEEVGSDVALEVEYSNRVHYHGLDGTEIRVRNTGDQAIPVLTVSIEKAFLDNYSDISFTPDVDDITDEAYIIRLEDVQPGEARIVIYESRGNIAGQHRGTITVTPGEEPASGGTSVTLDTFIFP